MPKLSTAKGLREIQLADNIFSALAHPTRRQILLSVHYRGVCNAGEIASRFDCSWPTTSRHLSHLVKAELLWVQSSGRERIYRANTRLIQSVLQQWTQYFE